MPASHLHPHAHPDPTTEHEVKDPVCGMSILPSGAAGRVEHRGETYYFCSPSCVETFRNNPDVFLTPKAPAAAANASDAREYTCPMHPEVVRDGPGACPICGMALEPRIVTLEEENHELNDMSRRFWWSIALTVPILAFMVSEFLPGSRFSARCRRPG